MPTSALSAVATTATWSDSRRAEMLSGLTMGVLLQGDASPRPGRAPGTAEAQTRPPRPVRAGHLDVTFTSTP